MAGEEAQAEVTLRTLTTEETTVKRFTNVLIPVLLVVIAACLGSYLPLAAVPAILGNTGTTADLNELMKVSFDDTLIKETVTDTELLDLFPEGEVKRGSEGRWFETSSLYQNTGAVGSRSEGGYIPEPSGAKAANGRINLKKIVGSIEETAEVLKKIKGDKAAFVNWAKEQFPSFKERLADELDRQALGDGSGIRARVNMADPDAEGLVVNRTYGITGLNQTLMQFQRGMNLRASANANGSSPRAGVMKVVDVDWENDAIVVNQLATSLANNDYLFEGDGADNSAGKDMMGLLGMVDNGDIVETLQFIDRSAHRWFQSYVHDVIDKHGAGTKLTEDVLIEADKVSRFRGGGKVDTIIASEDAFNAVWRDLRADRVINDPRSYTAGRKGISVLFGGTRTVEVRTARKLPSKLVFGLQRDQFRKFVLHDWEWDDTSGSIWKQVVDSTGRKDAHYSYGTMYGELAVKSAQRNWRVENWAD